MKLVECLSYWNEWREEMGGLNIRRCLHWHSMKSERGSSRDSLTGRYQRQDIQECKCWQKMVLKGTKSRRKRSWYLVDLSQNAWLQILLLNNSASIASFLKLGFSISAMPCWKHLKTLDFISHGWIISL